MSDKLVERLRGDWFGYDVSLKAIDAMDEAADRIEGLEENQRFIIRERDRTFALMLARAEKAELERDALREDVEELDFLRHEGGPDSVAAIEAERDWLRALLAEADRRIVWEANGFGNDFAERVEAALKGESHE